MHPTIIPLQEQSAWEYPLVLDAIKRNPNGRLPWLQDLCFRLLKRLGCQHPATAIRRVTTVEIRFDRIAEAVAACEESLRMVQNRQARYILVGRDKFGELMRASTAPEYMSLTFPADDGPLYAHGSGPAVRIFAGLIVVFCPWISGMCVLPELPRVDR
jgi:hypothetical protein